MKFVIDIIYLLAALAIAPKIIYRAVRQNRYRLGWSQRLGNITRLRPEKKCLWIHAVSLGEVNATKTLIARLKETLVDFEIIISTTTDTGFARANTLYGNEHKVFFFPLDFSFIMRKAFDNINPTICLLMELEVWPNFTQIASRRNIPVVVVNGRISDKSFPLYRRIRPLLKLVFQKVTLILAQTAEYAERFKTLGCQTEKVIVTGSLKYDTAQTTDKINTVDELADQLNIGDDKLLVAGGTGPGEEKIILEVFNYLTEPEKFPNLRLAIIPRKPERFDEAAQIITEAGFDFAKYSSIKNADTPLPKKTPVILGDTMGDLRKFYSLATLIFVGRSLVPMGGSDMMEAAALGKCTIFGPHTFNFKQTVDALLAGSGAIKVNNAEELHETIQKCLTDTAFSKKIANNGLEIIKKNQGATRKTVEQIKKLLSTSREVSLHNPIRTFLSRAFFKVFASYQTTTNAIGKA